MSFEIFDKLYKSSTYLYIKGNSTPSSVATGFFFQFSDKLYPVVITNRHVVEDKSSVVIQLQQDTFKPSKALVVLLDTSNVVFHPNKEIDLAIIKLNGEVPKESPDDNITFTAITEDMIPSCSECENFHYMEDVVMFGCPNGLWESAHGLPIARKGVTATPINVDFSTKSTFIVDIASYPGSSGSPIFIAHTNKLVGVLGKAFYRQLYLHGSNDFEAREYIHLCEAISSQCIFDFKSVSHLY